jgi:CBS domain-containing protein
MNIATIIRKDVVALHAEEAIEAAWRQMRDQKLGALPVTDAAGRLTGVLTEHDLLARLAPRRRPRWWDTIFEGTDQLAADYVKAVGVTVGDLMTAPPIAIEPDASIEAAADLMRQHAIGALPVAADGVCVGLLTRPDVLEHLSWPAAALPGTVADAELECLVQEGIQRELWVSRHSITVEAVRGVVRLSGLVSSPAERAALLAMARALAGCAGVEDRLVVLCRRGRRQPAPVI